MYTRRMVLLVRLFYYYYSRLNCQWIAANADADADAVRDQKWIERWIGLVEKWTCCLIVWSQSVMPLGASFEALSIKAF